MIETCEFSAEGILGLLRREGMRITRGRVGIMKTLFEARGPMTLHEIQAQAAKIAGVMPDYATVFRMICLLEQKQLVHRVQLQKACSYFELTDPSKHYDHLVCRECNKVILLDVPCPVEPLERELEEKYGFQDVHHTLEFFGKCVSCIRPEASVALQSSEV